MKPNIKAPHTIAPGKAHSGFSLIELLVAMTIGSIVILAVGYVFVGSRQTYRGQDAMARVQENARYLYEVLSNDIRMAGFTGCNLGASQEMRLKYAAAGDDPDWYKNLFGQNTLTVQPLYGYEDSTPADVCNTANTSPCYAQGDALTVLRSETSREYIVQSFASPTFTLTAAHDIQPGDVLVVSNCTDAAGVFQATAAAGATLNQDTATAHTPGNASALTGTYGAGSRIFRLQGVTYYIGTNPSGELALYRRVLGRIGTNAATGAEELAEGVENMQITYGIDTSFNTPATLPTADTRKEADQYLTATQVEANATWATWSGPATAVDELHERWSRVVSVRVSLLLRSTEDGITTQAQTYTYPPTPG